jgi:hypothetical protein
MRKKRGSTSTQVSTTHPILHATIERALPATHPSGPRHPTDLGNRCQAPFSMAHVKSSPATRFRVFSPKPICPFSRNRTGAPTAFNIVSTTQYRSPQFMSITPCYSVAKTDPWQLHFERGALNRLPPLRFQSGSSSCTTTSSTSPRHTYLSLLTAVSDGAHEIEPQHSLWAFFPPTHSPSLRNRTSHPTALSIVSTAKYRYPQ